MVATAEASRGFRLSVFEIACSSIFMGEGAEGVRDSTQMDTGLKSLAGRGGGCGGGVCVCVCVCARVSACTCACVPSCLPSSVAKSSSSCCVCTGNCWNRAHTARVAEVAVGGGWEHCESISGGGGGG